MNVTPEDVGYCREYSGQHYNRSYHIDWDEQEIILELADTGEMVGRFPFDSEDRFEKQLARVRKISKNVAMREENLNLEEWRYEQI